MLERRSTREEIALIRNKLESIDACGKSVVASEEAIQTALSTMGQQAERYLSDISYSLEAGLEALGAAFEWGIAELVYQLELQREELERIVEILEAPLETQAKELRRRAEFAHGNDWIDEALADFLEAEKKNYADFTIHQSLGNIYLRKSDLTKAEEYYEKAVKYARPRSSYYTAYALWHLGRVRCLQGNIGAAYEATKEATRVEPGLVQALYDHARHCALLMKEEESMSHLREAIEIDRNYSLKALTDESFAKVAQALGVLLEALRQEAKQRALEALEDCHECLRLTADMDSDFKWHPWEKYRRVQEKKGEELKALIEETYRREPEEEGEELEELIEERYELEEKVRDLEALIEGRYGPEEDVRKVEALIRRDSYFEFLDAEKLGSYIRDDFVDQAKRWLKSQIDRVSEQIKDRQYSIDAARRRLAEGGRPTYGEFEYQGSGDAGCLWPIIWPFYAFKCYRIRQECQHIIQSRSRERQTLQGELAQLNSLYARANVFYDIYGVRARTKKP